MIRRYLPWLFFAAAVCGLVGCLTAKHVSWAWVGYRIAHLGISLTYVWPQIQHMLHHLHR